VRGTILSGVILFLLVSLPGGQTAADSLPYYFLKQIQNQIQKQNHGQALMASSHVDDPATQLEQIQNHASKSRITARAVSRNLLQEIEGAIQALEAVPGVESESQKHVDVPKSCQRTPLTVPRAAEVPEGQIPLREYVEIVSRLDENCTKLLNYFRAVKVQVALKVRFIESIPEGNSLVDEDRTFLVECLRTAQSDIKSQLAMIGMYVRQIEKLCGEYNAQTGLT